MGLIRRFWYYCLELVYPNICVLCEETLAFGSHELVCPSCAQKHPLLKEDLCSKCGKPLQDLKKDRCLDCRKRVHFYDEGGALWVYEDEVKEAIYQYKYKNKRERGILFAKALVRYYNECKGWDIDLIVPVPLHRKNHRHRGFNQSELIAETMGRELDVKVMSKALKRVVQTESQKQLSDKDRILNMRDVFESDEEGIKGKAILIIDDVYTTGATIDACSKALVDQGASNIYYMSIAIGRGY